MYSREEKLKHFSITQSYEVSRRKNKVKLANKGPFLTMVLPGCCYRRLLNDIANTSDLQTIMYVAVQRRVASKGWTRYAGEW